MMLKTSTRYQRLATIRKTFSARNRSSDNGFIKFYDQGSPAIVAGSTLVEQMLPSCERSPTVLTREIKTAKGPIRLCIGAATNLSTDRPGNGGFRLVSYESADAMTEECVGLAQGMEIKHAVFNTGFSGAKVVADASKLENGVSSIDQPLKHILMEETSEILKSLKGTMFTGCDMNTTLDDMNYLADKCDYVLAAIGNRNIDPNVCTAFGVVGALDAVLGDGKGKTIVIHGCGNVGATVARQMADMGATVYTVDIDPERANISGCVNISESSTPWFETPCDAIVPCSKSGLFTVDIVKRLDTKVIVGATNLPFETDEAYSLAESRGVTYIPEGVSSAGAVIVDSVEHLDKKAFHDAVPEVMYNFVRDTVARKTDTLLQHSLHAPTGQISPVAAISKSAEAGKDGVLQDKSPIGLHFSSWLSHQGGQQQLARKFSTAAIVDEVEEAELKHTPYGEDGSGYYSEATKGCYDVIENAKEIVSKAVDQVLATRQQNGAASRNEVFSIADFGTADAGTSMPLMNAVVAQVRAAEGQATPIVIGYEDQTNNDWNSVFRRVHGLLPSPVKSYMQDETNVFALAAGTSFYQACFPAQSIDVSFSATAMHWLSSVPCVLPDALHSACSEDSSATVAFAAQAAKDWAHILKLREAELKEGGQLVIVNFAKDSSGNFLGKSPRMSASMHHCFSEIWRDLVTVEEFTNTNFPNEYRSLEAQAAPFKDGTLTNMKLISADTRLVNCPFYDGFHGLSSSYSFAGDAEGHALNYVPTTRTWSNSTFLAGLDASRSEEEKHALVDELFRRYSQRVAGSPSEHAMDYTHAYIHAEKVTPVK